MEQGCHTKRGDPPIYGYFPSIESANLILPEVIAVAGMADQEGQEEHKGEESDWPNEETQHWHHLHIRRVNRHAHPVHDVRRLPWNDWYTQYSYTLYNHGPLWIKCSGISSPLVI